MKTAHENYLDLMFEKVETNLNYRLDDKKYCLKIVTNSKKSINKMVSKSIL